MKTHHTKRENACAWAQRAKHKIKKLNPKTENGAQNCKMDFEHVGNKHENVLNNVETC